MRAPGLQLGSQAAPKALADCHTNVALVNVGSPDASNLPGRPAHDVSDFFVGLMGKDQLGAKGPAKVVDMLLFGRSGFWIDMDDVGVIAHPVEACSKPIVALAAANQLLSLDNSELPRSSANRPGPLA